MCQIPLDSLKIHLGFLFCNFSSLGTTSNSENSKKGRIRLNNIYFESYMPTNYSFLYFNIEKEKSIEIIYVHRIYRI